ncbi:DUF1365 domain-containing protein [Nocardia suismassiliense]|uniref:DUF1365 domain-containing protein n=1 Tax=Nocardia suismassiliense TaxID=2077092 RepID=UPI001F1C13AA
MRTEPLTHAFQYNSVSWYVDIDELPHIPVLARFRAEDHLAPPGKTVRQRVDAVLSDNGIRDTGRITALLAPRSFGYVFNPLSIFWCHDDSETVTHILLEVHNTEGDRYCYVTAPDERGYAEVDKRFRVSPFNDVSGYYGVTAPEPAHNLSVRIVLHDGRGDFFVATMTGAAADTHLSAVWSVFCNPALATSIRIRWQGLGLWFRGLPVIGTMNSRTRWKTGTS